MAILKTFSDSKDLLDCKFKIPTSPPNLPDYLVLEVENYNGPNIFGFEESKNWVPIRLCERYKELDNDKKHLSHRRISFPIEGGDSFTAFKGQGATLNLIEVKLLKFVEKPGLFLVGISRTKHPNNILIPQKEMPNSFRIYRVSCRN